MANETDELAQLISKLNKGAISQDPGKLAWKFSNPPENHTIKDAISSGRPIYPSRANGANRMDGSVIAVQFDSTMVGYWSFDDPAEPTDITVYDAIQANRNNGTINSTATWVDGKYNTGLSLNGTDNYVEIPDHSAYQITSAITVEAWIQITDNITQQMIFTHSYKNADWTWELFMFNGSIGFQVYIGGFQLATQYIVATPQIYPWPWQHVAGTYDGANVYCYVNGTPGTAKAATGAIATASIPMRIGGQKTGAGGTLVYPLLGLVDEVRLYNSALSPQRIFLHSRGCYRFP